MITRGIIGVASSLFVIGITLTQFEQWIRVAGALVGLAVGVVSLASMIRKWGKG
jgi:hypothetical protein